VTGRLIKPGVFNQCINELIRLVTKEHCYLFQGNRKLVNKAKNLTHVQHTNISKPGCLSVSSDGVIYLISAHTIVYQSTDDGLVWSRMFSVTDGWRCLQVIKVSTDSNTDVLWTVVWLGEYWVSASVHS
jgi:hypothetical protein